jgi:hypothetical protein
LAFKYVKTPARTPTMPLVDVAAADGWRDLRSLENCYTLPDSKTILSVVTAPNKIRDAEPVTA